MALVRENSVAEKNQFNLQNKKKNKRLRSVDVGCEREPYALLDENFATFVSRARVKSKLRQKAGEFIISEDGRYSYAIFVLQIFIYGC